MIRFALIVASTLGFLLTAAMGNLMVPLLRSLQNRNRPAQTQQAPGPDRPENADPELERPAQPPTMGGLCLMVGVLAAVGVGWTAACVAEPQLLGAEGLLSTRLLIALFGALLFGGVGLADDIARIRRRSPLGLRRGTRLLLEAGAGYVGLGVLAPLLWEAELVALAESVRITDEMDGLCCGTAFAVMLGLMLCMTVLGWFPLAVLPAALAGALMAFLLWNFPPAKLRLGSVGSLFLAGALGCIPLCIGWPDLALPLGLPYWLEGGMVFLQIVIYKLSHGRKQLFRTAPLHRWMEVRGSGSVQIFYAFCAAALLGAALALQWAKIS